MKLNEIIREIKVLSAKGEKALTDESRYNYSQVQNSFANIRRLADELKAYDWIPVEEKRFPDKPGNYHVTLQDGKVYNVVLDIYQNGPAWMFSRSLEIGFETCFKEKPKVIAWHENPEPYKIPVDKIKVPTETLSVSKILTVSTAHVTKAMYKMLVEDMNDSSSVMLPVYEKTDTDGTKYGLFIYIPADINWDRIPKGLKPLLELAISNECDVVCLDSDGSVIKELPVYEW